MLRRVALSIGCVKICKLLEQSAAHAKLTINVGNIPSQSWCPLGVPDNPAAHRASSPASPLLKTIHLVVVGPGFLFTQASVLYDLSLFSFQQLIVEYSRQSSLEYELSVPPQCVCVLGLGP